MFALRSADVKAPFFTQTCFSSYKGPFNSGDPHALFGLNASDLNFILFSVRVCKLYSSSFFL